MAILGWSNANCCKKNGADKMAFITMFASNARQIKFQPKIISGSGYFL
jgi:hypothetical protein